MLEQVVRGPPQVAFCDVPRGNRRVRQSEQDRAGFEPTRQRRDSRDGYQ